MNRREKSIQGFTLMEVLIGMTLLSLMVALLFTSLKICADSWEKGENKIAEVDEASVVYNFFQQYLSSARPLWNDFDGENNQFAFQGRSQSLQFVSVFPVSAGKSGPQLFSVELQEEDGERVLKVVLTPFFPAAEGEQWHREEAVLVRNVSDFSLAYFGSEDGVSEGEWQSEWLEKQVQPALVKVTVKRENEVFWPDMIIGLKAGGAGISVDQDTLAQQDEQ